VIEFTPGVAKTAIAPITVKPSGLSCEAEVFLGPNDLTKVATSGKIPFTSTGLSQDVHLPVTMPSAEGTYHVFIDIYAEGLLIAAYQAIEDVGIVSGVAELWFDPHLYYVGGESGGGGMYTVHMKTRIENRGTGPGTLWLQYTGSGYMAWIGKRCAFPVGEPYSVCHTCPNPNNGDYYPLTLAPGEAVDFMFGILFDLGTAQGTYSLLLYPQPEGICGCVGSYSAGTYTVGQIPETYPY